MRAWHLTVGMGALLWANVASATPILVNGGFETGDFTGWVENSSPQSIFVQTVPAFGYSAHSGSDYVEFATTTFQISGGSGDTLSQTFSDTASHTLKISYWIDSDGQTPNFLEADYNATPLDSHTNFGTTGYTEYSFTVIGTGSDTLTFRAYDNPSYIALDDVSVTDITVPAVPESSTWAMMLMGFAGLGCMGVRSRRRMIAA